MQKYYIDFSPLAGFSLLLFSGKDCISSVPLTIHQYDALEAAGVPKL